jgi:hypothetical protein
MLFDMSASCFVNDHSMQSTSTSSFIRHAFCGKLGMKHLVRRVLACYVSNTRSNLNGWKTVYQRPTCFSFSTAQMSTTVRGGEVHGKAWHVIDIHKGCPNTKVKHNLKNSEQMLRDACW